jgi:hypothetical protein
VSDDPTKALKALREPFQPESVGLLPRATKRNIPDAEKRVCPDCGAFIGPHIHLSYVGWSAVVDRILSNDLFWTWDAYATDDHGLPMYRESPNGLEVELWIRLTIAGVTRPGVGIVNKGDEDLGKKLVSDALKNAAAKFGLALDLWNKDELESLIGNQTVASRKRKPPRGSTAVPAQSSPALARVGGDGSPMMPATDRNRLKSYLAKQQPPVVAEKDVLAWLGALDALSGRPEPLKALSDLTASEGHAIMSELDIG